MSILLYSAGGLFLLGAGVICFLIWKKLKKERLWGNLNMTLFHIRMPKYGEKKDKEGSKILTQMEQVYSRFLYLNKPDFFKSIVSDLPHVILEIASQVGEEDLSFYIAVPSSLEKALPKYIHGIYPGASVEKVPEDYTIFEPKGKTAGGYLKLGETPFLPIDTYRELEKDPLESIISSMTRINPEEGVAIQLVIRPVFDKSWKKKSKKVLSKVKQGDSLKAAASEVFQPTSIKILKEFVNIFAMLLTGKMEDSKEEKEKLEERKSVDEETVEAVQKKIQKDVFATNIRLITSAQNTSRAQEILNDMYSSFTQYSISGRNRFKLKEVKKKSLEKLAYNFSFRIFDSSQEIILNLEELSSIYHFPTIYSESSYLKTVKSKEASPPSEACKEGLITIGKAVFRGEKRKVSFLSREDRRRHFYVIGQTGTGKSSLFRELIRQDIESGEGVGVIDPHGDLIEDTLANIPKERAGEVVLFEPFDTERPVGLNMLEYKNPEQKDFAVQEMVSIFHELFPPEIIGPMFEHYMRNALLALMADKNNPGTLVEVSKMFTDEKFMKERLERVSDPLVRNFWLKEWKQTTGATRSDMLGYVVSKVGRFVENEMMRNIIGQSHSGFDLAKIMDEGKIFLANLSKGQTGEVNSSLLGLILVSKIQMAAMRRAAIPQKERKDFYLYIDEFQNFTTESIATILSEARKYRLNLILANQYVPQLEEDIRNAVLGNAGTIGSFRVGSEDAEFLEKQFEPEFSRFDLVNLDNFTLILKMMIQGKTSPPFKVKSIYPKEGNYKIVEKIKKLSRLKYGRPKKEVEKEIARRLGVDR